MKARFEKYYSGFVKAPLFWAASLFCLGIALSTVLDLQNNYLFFILGPGLAAVLIWLISRNKKNGRSQNLIFLFLCAALVAIGSYYYFVWLPCPDSAVQTLGSEAPVRLHLKVIKTSEQREKYSRVLCDLVELDSGRGAVSERGRLWLSYSDEETFFPGDEFMAWARLRSIAGFKNPFVPDFSLRFKRSGIYFSATQLKEVPIYRLGRSKSIVAPALYRFRQKVKDELDRSGSNSSYLLDAMLLGEKDAVPDEVWKQFQATNTAHILVISGFNLSLIGAFFFILILGFFRAQPWLLKRYDPYPIAAILTAIPITFYAIITGLELPTFRALVMSLVLLTAIALRKTREMLNALGLAALISLLINPSSLFDASFQLSYLSVFVLVAYFSSNWNLFGKRWFDEEKRLI